MAERATIAFFGIRGIGSFYYLAYALNEERFAGAEELWAVATEPTAAVAPATATPAMRRRAGEVVTVGACLGE